MAYCGQIAFAFAFGAQILGKTHLNLCFSCIRLPSTFLYPRLSVDRRLRLGTGWEPPIRGSEMFELPLRAHLTDFCQFFLQKAHGTSIAGVEIFLGGPKIIFTSSNGSFFRGTDTFPEMRGPSQN